MTELERLQDRIEQLEKVLGTDRCTAGKISDAFGLEIEQGQVLGLLYTREFVSRDGLFAVLHGNRPESEWPEDKSLDALLSKLRKAVAPYGISFDTRWGQGWAMGAGSKAIICQAISEPTAEQRAERYRKAFGLQPKQAQILALMVDRPSVTAASLTGIVSGYGAARLQVHRIRRTMAAHGVVIDGSYGRWSVPPQSRAQLETVGNGFCMERTA